MAWREVKRDVRPSGGKHFASGDGSYSTWVHRWYAEVIYVSDSHETITAIGYGWSKEEAAEMAEVNLVKLLLEEL